MSIAAAAAVPHPPLLIPTIGKENALKVKNTASALEKLALILVDKKIDTVLIISPHGFVQMDAFTMNLSPEYISNFEDFGDFETKLKWRSDIELIHKTKESLESSQALQLASSSELDYASAVPLYFLTKDLPQVRIIPLYYSGLSLHDHFEFAKDFKKIISKSNKQVAIIASGDLSHRITKDAPAGYSPKGKKFDKKLIKLLSESRTDEILNLNPELVEEAGECGLRSIVLMLGMLEGTKNTPKLLSYEAPFGVGYMVMNFEI